MQRGGLESGTTLLERENELAAIDAGMDGASRGEGSLLLIEGEAGVGKTALLAWARKKAAERGIEPLLARGGELEQNFAFGIARQLFEAPLALAGELERDELLSGAASLARPALGLTGARLPLSPVAPAVDPAVPIHHGLYWLCANLAERTPLLLSIDDLHWGDAISVRWLLYLTRRLEGLPVVVMAAVRPGESEFDIGLLNELKTEPTTRMLRPDPLSERASTELIRARMAEEADATFCSACHAATGGNPFLLGELVEAVRADEIAPAADSAGAIAELVPETISRSTLLRIARLPPTAMPLARAIAVLGAEADPRHAAKLARIGETEAAEAADAMAATSLLAEGAPYRFAHPLLRTAVYEQIPANERGLHHAQAARLLAKERASAEQVATHLLHAAVADEQWVVDTLADAATAVLGRGAPDAAIVYLRRALREPASSTRRVELLSMLLDAGVAAGQPAILEEVSDDPIAELTATPELLVDSVLRLGMWLFTVARFEEANEVFGRAIAEARRAGQDDRALRFEMQRLSVIPVRGADALARLKRCADVVCPGTPEERLWLAQEALWQTSLVRSSAGDCAELAKRALADGRIFAEQTDTASVGQAILVLIWADARDAAEGWIEHGTDDTQRRGSRFGFAGMVGLRSHLAYRSGDIPAAVEHARTAIQIAREHHFLLAIPVYTCWLIDALIERADYDEAEEELSRSGLGGELPDHWWFSPTRFSRAALDLARGRAESALDDLRLLVRLAEAGDPAPALYPVFAQTALALDAIDRDSREQSRLIEHEMARARRWGTPRALGTTLRAMGALERGERGIELLTESAALLADSPARLEYGRALTDLGAALRRGNRRREARKPLREALDLATRCGATAIAERARDELAATGAKPRRMMLTGVDSLTPSELRIARMAAKGMTNKEIAQALFVTVKTVEMHLGHTYAKLEISSRSELPETLAASR